jgi:hypothetical protein
MTQRGAIMSLSAASAVSVRTSLEYWNDRLRIHRARHGPEPRCGKAGDPVVYGDGVQSVILQAVGLEIAARLIVCS